MTHRLPQEQTVRTLSRRQFLAAGGALVLAGTRASAQTPVPVARPLADLRIAVQALPATWDPLANTSLEHVWLSTLVFDPIARWNIDGDILPALGIGWGMTTFDRVLEITLRPDAFFGNGTALTAEDVRWTLERVRYSDQPDAWRLEHVWRIEAPDAHTLRIILKAPDASLLSSLASPVLGVLAASSTPANVRGGTGPFDVISRTQGLVTCRRNPMFWQIGRPRFESLRIREIADDTERSTALVTGQIDLLPDAPLLDIPTLQADPSVQLVGGPSNHLCLLHVNLRQPPFHDVRLRRLLSTAIDRSRLVKVATAGQADATGLLFPPDSWPGGGVDDVEQKQSDTIRSELADLGIRTDLRLKLITDNTDATLANTAIVLQEQLAYCGIALSVVLLDPDALEEAIQIGDFDLLAGYTRPWRDPHELVRPLLATDGYANVSGYFDPEADGLIRGAIIIADRDLRQERYKWLQNRILDDVPVIVLFRPYYFDAMTARLKNYAKLQPVTARGLMPAALDPADQS